MKQIVRFGLLLIIFTASSAQAALDAAAPAQKDQTAQTLSGKKISHMLLFSTELCSDCSSDGTHHHGTTILVRKYKPRSTQPTRGRELLTSRAVVERVHTPEFSGRRTMRMLIMKSGLIVPVAELKHVHTVNEQMIFSLFNQYRNFISA